MKDTIKCYAVAMDEYMAACDELLMHWSTLKGKCVVAEPIPHLTPVLLIIKPNVRFLKARRIAKQV
jgi:hypothetical protein